MGKGKRTYLEALLRSAWERQEKLLARGIMPNSDPREKNRLGPKFLNTLSADREFLSQLLGLGLL
jgi:hypothetical protein